MEISDERIESYVLTLRNGDTEARNQAVWELSQLRDNRAGGLLLSLIADDGVAVEVRAKAVYLLGELTSEEAYNALVGFLESRERDFRLATLTALRYRKDKQALNPLIRLLSDPDSTIRGGAVLALGDIADEFAVEPLLPLLNDPEANVRGSTAWALGEISSPLSAEPLLAALHDRNWSVSQMALAALLRLDSSAVQEKILQVAENPQTEWRLRWELAWRLAQRTGNHWAIGVMIEALQTPDAEFYVTAGALAQVLTHQPIPLLINAIEKAGGGLQNQLIAEFKAGLDQRAVPVLEYMQERAGDDLELRRRIVEALNAIERG